MNQLELKKYEIARSILFKQCKYCIDNVTTYVFNTIDEN